LTVPLVVHHGTPGAGVPYEPFVEAAAERGLQYVAYSRPGYADAPRQEGRSVADCATFVGAMLDELEVDRCYTLGWSGGGPHALACAALLGDRVIKAAVVAGVAPWGAEGLDWQAGMGEENLQEFTAVEAGPDALREFLDATRSRLTGITADEVVAALGDLVGEADRRAVPGPFAAWLATSFRTALAHSSDGWFDDDLAFFCDWGFDLGAIDVPVTIWQGDDDRMVPCAHGQWVAAHVRGARAELRRGEGHISLLVDRFGEILDDLIAA
jgi:pimeloyl-ACP methyl ester carboxylesterase